MNKSIEVLYNEHKIIKSVIDCREKIIALSNENPEKYNQVITELINFFRNYADKFHHHKEEILLFPLMCEKNEMLEDSIIEEMLDNHRDFKELVKQIESETSASNYDEANKLLFKYTEMLLDHIAVEDEELFQIAETLFDVAEFEKMYYDFEDIDRELGLDRKKELERLNETLNLILSPNN